MSENKIVLTTCTRDCPDTCGINARVVGGRLVALNGVRGHDITHGFLCRKAADCIRRVYSRDRLRKPLRKVDGEWREMSWDEAFTLVAALIKRSIDQYGSLSILHYQSAGSIGALKVLNKRFFNLLGGVTEASGSLCGGPHSRRWVHFQILPHDHDAPLEAKVNPETAQAGGIEDGGAATVVSEAGSLAVVARHDEGVPVGVVSIEQGRWLKYHQSVNQLTSPIMSFDGENACYYQTPVKLVK